MQGERALVMLTRAPEPGQTKTRMMPDLSPAQCAELHASILHDMSDVCGDLPEDVDVLVAYAPEGAERDVRAVFDAPAVYFAQQGAALGERLSHASREALSRGYERCVLVGADAPEVTTADVLAAFDALEDADAVFGPAVDGGFYLVGLRVWHSQMFGLSSYGHDRVLRQTTEALAEAGLSVRLLRQVADIDCWQDALDLLERARVDRGVAQLHAVRYLREVVS